jgi:Ca2+-binding EF-hand superfamily protein
MNRKLILAAALAASVLSGGVAIAAQAQTSQPAGPSRAFTKADRNGDGVVSRQEYLDAAARKFTKVDRNGDGRLTPDEMTKGGRKGARRGMRGGDDTPPPPPRSY